MTVRLERVALPDVPWPDLDRRPDRTPYQTLGWLDVLSERQGAEPVVARVHLDDEPVGWFTGAIVRRAGLRILGAPLRGWATGPMGFNLDVPIPFEAAGAALRHLAFAPLGCAHVEVASRQGLGLGLRDYRDAGLPGFRLDLRKTEDDLWRGMRQMARRNVRRATRAGVTVEAAHLAEPGLADEIHAHLVATFALKGARPRATPADLAAILFHVPDRHLLVLRARSATGRSASVGIFPGVPEGGAGMWLAAGDPTERADRPNDALMWEAMAAWRRRGATWFEFGGGGDYKAKFGGTPEQVPWVRSSRWPGVAALRDQAARLLTARR